MQFGSHPVFERPIDTPKGKSQTTYLHNLLEQNLGKLRRAQSVERATELVYVSAAVAVEVACAVVDSLGEILNANLFLLYLVVRLLRRKLVLRVLTHF